MAIVLTILGRIIQIIVCAILLIVFGAFIYTEGKKLKDAADNEE